MSYGRLIASNTVIMLVGKALTTALSVALTAILARNLGIDGFGEFNTALAFISLFGVLADFGFFQILVRELARDPQRESEIASSILLLRSIFGAVVYGIAAGLVWFFPYSVAVKQSAMILALASFLLTLNSSLIAIFQVHHTMIKAVIGDIAGRAALLGGMIWAFERGWGLPELFFVYLAANLLNLLISLPLAQQLVPLTNRINPRHWGSFLHFAWPLGLTAIFTILYFKGDTVILSILKTPTDVGIYSAAYKIFEIIIMVPMVIMGNVLPALTRSMAAGGEVLAKFIQKIFDATAIIGIGASFGLAGLASKIIKFLFGSENLVASTVTVFGHPVTAADVLVILSIAVIGIFGANFWSFLIIAQDRQRKLLTSAVVATIASFTFYFLLIPRWSYLAAALVTVATEIFIFVSWGRIAHRALRQRLSWQTPIRALLAGGGMLAVLWSLPDWNLVGMIVIGGSVYLGLLWIVGVRDSLSILGRSILQGS